jgi:site-specific recombinase XerD
MNFEHLRQVGQYWVLDLPVTKGGADQYVKVPDHIVDSIMHHRSHYGYGEGAVWRSLSNNSKGRRLSSTSIYNIVRKAAMRAGLEGNIGAHTLRHTGCTLAIETGASLQQVQAHARHKSLETTMMYVHQRERLRDSAADYINLD